MTQKNKLSIFLRIVGAILFIIPIISVAIFAPSPTKATFNNCGFTINFGLSTATAQLNQPIPYNLQVTYQMGLSCIPGSATLMIWDSNHSDTTLIKCIVSIPDGTRYQTRPADTSACSKQIPISSTTYKNGDVLKLFAGILNGNVNTTPAGTAFDTQSAEQVVTVGNPSSNQPSFSSTKPNYAVGESVVITFTKFPAGWQGTLYVNGATFPLEKDAKTYTFSSGPNYPFTTAGPYTISMKASDSNNQTINNIQNPNDSLSITIGSSTTSNSPTVDTDKKAYAPGENIIVSYKNFPTGWTGILSVNGQDYKTRVSGNTTSLNNPSAADGFNLNGQNVLKITANDGNGNPITVSSNASFTISPNSTPPTTNTGVNPCLNAPSGTTPPGCVFNPLGTSKLVDMFLWITKGFLGILGIWSVMFIIVGGFRMVLAAGNEEAIGVAKKTITWAVLGLVLALLSFSIIAILQGLLGADVKSVPLGLLDIALKLFI